MVLRFLGSGLVKFSDLKGASVAGKASKAGAVPDSLMTQREEPPSEAQEPPAESGGGEETEGKTLRRRTRKAAANTGGGGGSGSGSVEDKSNRSRRQRDFDPNAVDEDSDEERRASVPAPQKEKSSTATEDVWTQNQQKLLELALQQYPRGTTERWDRIAKVVPGKSKVGDAWPEQFKPANVTEWM